ncbi:MAG: Coenzyme F420 hydrogenase/dehydrogenase, beta subunit C-terminal domain [Deltaproteobacteria bacterium]|nr:Coenzyme F420 hydrogenase/dehydrogenase, beta subunit C-terminal domain [Deltaproteobacteria bacterium]
MKIKNVEQVAQWRMCLGCGACAYGCNEKKIKLIDVISDGIRPVIQTNDCGTCEDCLKFCPGYEISHHDFNEIPEAIEELKQGWGPVLELWEGYAADPEIRYKGSSGGLASALALYCIENENMYGVVHTGAKKNEPWKNETVLSRTRDELLSRTGSRYSPASPCDGLEKIEKAPSECVFIGKPCDISGVRKAQEQRPALDDKMGLAIGIFCAGTPSSLGTLELLKKYNLESSGISEVRYRGNGWPGHFAVKTNPPKAANLKITYLEAWGFLQKYRPLRCYLCPDGTSEFADISCGDPWYREIKEGEAGQSLVLVRTEKGKKILYGAMNAGYVVLKRTGPAVLTRSQENLLDKRRTIWGRLLARRLFLLPSPTLKGFSLFDNWRQLTLKDKVRSVAGTIRRIIKRKHLIPYKYLSQAGVRSTK